MFFVRVLGFTCFILSFRDIDVDCRQIPVTQNVRSDLIVTKFGPDVDDTSDEKQPGWMRRTLMRFGEMASQMGNKLGGHAVKVTNAIDKICEIVKTVIPVISAVCTVGQFKFCAATDGVAGDVDSALSPNPSDLNIQD